MLTRTRMYQQETTDAQQEKSFTKYPLLLFWCCFVLQIGHLQAQEDTEPPQSPGASTALAYGSAESIYQITIIDGLARTVISGVHIYDETKQISTTTDETGKTTINSNDLDAVLVFQHISYEKYELPLADLKQQSKNGQLVIELFPKETELDALVVSVGKIVERMNQVTNKVEVISPKSIAAQQMQTAADLLQSTGSVYIQKSQMGGGSPVIRGFEANKVLIVVDGVRLNNAIFRGGHLQNVITIDPNILQRTEVVFGPGSVIYGSDALGGVMHFITRKPELSGVKGKTNFNANASLRLGTANDEINGHIDVSWGGEKFGALTSLTNTSFG
ncbi:MAG: TonB-dependent receptor plug domain-containing protein, partial [Chitinophagales bacterium]